MSQLLEASPASDWRRLRPEDTLQLELPAGRVVIELAPGFAPRHSANLRALVRGRYFDGPAIVRAQDDLVIRTARLAAELPEGERASLEVLRTESATFAALVEARRNRRDRWYLVPAGRIDLCSVPRPVRPATPGQPVRRGGPAR